MKKWQAATTNQQEHQDANTGRAKHALVALNVFANNLGTESENAESVIRDMLTNLNHSADKCELDFDDLVERAKRTYLDEV
ncbi:hypothetical protein [Vibrio crassostreae]|uniref:hypothetical protein n=1 Tax=Vibrio crassostreae TaxID=246167 RepID=UPI001B30BBC4|nr:hypothetical protein [Vibrio crassostreae]